MGFIDLGGLGAASAVPRARLIWALVTVLAIGWIARWWLLAHIPELWTLDSRSYLRIAAEIAENGSFAERQLGILRLPGYPLFLAIVRVLFGSSASALLAAQAAVGLAAVAIAFQLGRLLCGGIAGACALGLFVALNPAYLTAEHGIMSESLFLALLLGGSATFLAASKSGSPSYLFAVCGIAVGACMLVRLNAIALFLALGVLLLVTNFGPRGRRTQGEPSWRNVTLLLLSGSLLLIPWIHRNRSQLGFATIYASGSKQALVNAIEQGLVDTAPLLAHSQIDEIAKRRDPGFATFWSLLDRFGPVESENAAANILEKARRDRPLEFIRAQAGVAMTFLGYRGGDQPSDIGRWLRGAHDGGERLNQARKLGRRFLEPTSGRIDERALEMFASFVDTYYRWVRPLLCTAGLGSILVVSWRWVRGRRTVDWLLVVLAAGFLGTLALHAWLLSEDGRYAVPFDWLPLAILLRAWSPSADKPPRAELKTIATPDERQ